MPTLTLNSSLRTDLGRRGNNEDALFATSRLLAVADGVGGAVAGEVASRMVIDQMASLDKRRLCGPLDDELREAVLAANQRLGFMISCRPHLAGMASTLTALALSNEGEYLVANVGDSRTYLLRDGELQQLTRDGSYVQALIDHGAISANEARRHPQRSVVLEALDGGQNPEPEIVRIDGRAEDRLLLCSDGLSDVVDDERIAAILRRRSREEAAERLVAVALEQGGRDNVSVVVADVTWAEQPSPAWLPALPATGSSHLGAAS
ncbi:MAG TPA: protein phosphatase 2C domain-containing protein [Solirubrobacteraceae bacterium]|nr:protein phosphatase 2C domain-containing protein [Solirubrobacteraceae bacterium]